MTVIEIQLIKSMCLRQKVITLLSEQRGWKRNGNVSAVSNLLPRPGAATVRWDIGQLWKVDQKVKTKVSIN